MDDQTLAAQQSQNSLVDYRLQKVEEAITALKRLEEVVLRWDARFSQGSEYMQCPLHKVKMEDITTRIEKIETIVAELDKFKWKAVGVLSVVLLIVQLFGSAISDRILHPVAATSQISTTVK